MTRTRTIRHTPHYSFGSIGEFLSSKRRDSGMYSVRCGHDNHFIDVRVKNQQSKVTVVTFNGALSPRTKYLPVFSGSRMTEQAQMNLIAISDPSLVFNHGKLNIAWYLGNKYTGPLKPVLSPMIRHLLKSLGTKRTILFGPSGGGYSALNFAADFPGALVLAINPRLNMINRPVPTDTLGEYLSAAFGATTDEEKVSVRAKYIVDDIASLYETRGLPFDLLIAQNLGDQRFLHGQVQPFYEKFKNDRKLFVRFDNYSDTHSPIPSALLDEILYPLSRPGFKRKLIKEAGFLPAAAIDFPHS